jgi:hypothetical protein
MARQFREQLEEEVQLEEARKAHRPASPPPVEPVATAAEPPHTPSNGGAAAVTPEVSYAHHDQPSHHAPAADHTQTAGSSGTDPTAGRPAQAGGADERRT